MKKKRRNVAFLFSVSAAVVFVALIAPSAMAKDEPAKTWKVSKSAHLRGAPSSQSPVVASVPKDAVLASFQPCTKGWCAVEYKGIRGWIYDIFIVEMPGKAAPVAAPPPPKPLARASLERLSPAPAPVAAPKEGVRLSYRLIGLKAEESLAMREGPADTARVVGALSSSATGIAGLETCVRRWCLIERDGVRGYVQSRFLGRMEEAPSPRFGVEGEADVKVFSFGSTDADVVGEIPFYAGGIKPIGDCNAEWCHVRYLGLVGFVETGRLRPEASSGG